MTRVAFTAPEYQANGTVRPARYAFEGSERTGWEIERERTRHLHLGAGYRLLAVRCCGVCATDLARRHLPFPLPQVTGHEVVACDDDGAASIVEINASHAARGLPPSEWCAHCRQGLRTHCPERLVLGIHDLPGGFGPWILAPVHAVLPLPPEIDAPTGTLVEPFAAALHAVDMVAPRVGDRIAVLGPGRLGSLVVAALAARRAAGGPAVEIVAIGRKERSLARARTLGADVTLRADEAVRRIGTVDVVIETTGSAAGLGAALALGPREIHLKSTTGQPAAGLRHLTELVVDELSLVPFPGTSLAGTVIVSPTLPPAVRAAVERGGGTPVSSANAAELPLGGADAAVVASLDEVDAIIRPWPGVERGLVRTRGRIALAGSGNAAPPLVRAVHGDGVVISASRCGDPRTALGLLADPARGLADRLRRALVREVLPAERLAEALARASEGGSKIVVAQPA